MPLTPAQKTAIEEVIGILVSATPPRGKRLLATMFMELVDRSDWPEYYEVIPEPRCIKGIQTNVEKNRYKDPLAAYTDLSLVFWNAMFYNEEGSQISSDAETLKSMLVAEWQKRPLLGAVPRLSPPPQSAQRVHGVPDPERDPDPSPSTSAQAKNTITIQANNAQSQAQPQQTPSTSRPIPRASSPSSSAQDMDVDIGGSPDLDQPGSALEPEAEADRSADGDEEIVRQLERTLPRWEGFSENGWMAEVGQDRLLEIVLGIKAHKDAASAVSTRLAQSLEAVPEDPTSPHLSYQASVSLKLIEGRARAGSYASAQAFDLDMTRLFEKARRFYEPCTEPYGHVLLLQRLYQALTSASPPAGPPYTSSTNFASVRAGPGNARPLHSASGSSTGDGGNNEGVAVTTFRVTTKDRRFVDEVNYKGLSVRLADWLHVANPDDPSRPIVGQVFKCWVSEETSRKGQHGVTVCWYYRPEQTFHPASKRFMEKEVFKTSHFADHPLEDIIEKIACQFTARHIRGRPKAPAWHPGWPLYVCDARYNDRERLFVRIKNWNSCVPEEVRKSDEFMPIAPFERLVYPRKLPSPFVVAAAQTLGQGQEQGQGHGPGQGPPQGLLAKDKKAPGPGGIGESVERPAGAEVDAAGRRKPNRAKTQPTPQQPAQQLQNQQQAAGPARVAAAAAVTPMTPAQQAYYQPYVATPGPAQALAASQMQTQTQLQLAAAAAVAAGNDRDRTMLGAAGTLSTPPVVERLPPETTQHFERSPETGELLWFAAPPMNVPMVPAPRHSLAYLHYLAKKRKKAAATEGNGLGESEGEGDDGSGQAKRRKTQVRPTAMEAIQQAAREIALD